MGHLASKQEILGLQKRLDQNPIGAPSHPYLTELIEQLFTAEECRLAAAMPLQLSSARRVARCAGMDIKRTETILRALVEKGLVADFEKGGKSIYFLNPTVVGFFEFTMMRVRDDVDQKKAADLLYSYMREDPSEAFIRMMGEGPTYIGRPLVHEDMLRPEVSTEVLDYEKATHIIESADTWAEGVCYCRHIKLHRGQQCDHPLDHCLALGFGAKYLIGAGIAKEIPKERALDVLQNARERGLVQMGDNVKNRPTFICNCCSCCCEMLEGLRRLPDVTRFVTSNHLACIDERECTGCGKCRKACPINVIDWVGAGPIPKKPKRNKRASVNEQLCIGCGVCARACEHDALSMEPIGQRTYTPDTIIEKLVVQAVERGKLGQLIFDDPTAFSHVTLARLINAIMGLPPAQYALSQKQVKSRFISTLLEGMKLTRKTRKAVASTA